MVQPAVGALPSRVVDVDGGRPESASRLVSLAEAKGVLRDVLAAVRNLEHLLRSPRRRPARPRSSHPGSQGALRSALAAVEQILEHVAASNATSARPIAIDAALTSLRGYVPEVCDRLRTALDKVAGVALDCQEPLVVRSRHRSSGGRAQQRCASSLDSAGASGRRVPHRALHRRVAPSHLFADVSNRAGQASRAGDRVLRGRCERFRGEPPGLDAAHHGRHQRGADLRATAFRCPRTLSPRRTAWSSRLTAARGEPGEEYQLDPPMRASPPSVICLEAAARLASGAFEVGPGGASPSTRPHEATDRDLAVTRGPG